MTKVNVTVVPSVQIYSQLFAQFLSQTLNIECVRKKFLQHLPKHFSVAVSHQQNHQDRN